MNTNFTITCKTCEQDVDVRFGYSNRLIQPLTFACPHCESLLGITLSIEKAPESDFSFDGCEIIKERQTHKLFDGKNPFVDLHLDFPIWTKGYVPGLTPYMMAMQVLHASQSEEKSHLLMLSTHGRRLSMLNDLALEKDKIRVITRLYLGKNKQLFIKRVNEFFGGNAVSDSLLPQDVNAALYLFLSFVFSPFLENDIVKDFVFETSKLLIDLTEKNKKSIDEMVSHFINTNYLSNLQKDCLELYVRVFDAEMPLRCALFVDLLDTESKDMTSAKVSIKDFFAYKDLYKDMAEVFGRQLILVAAINNLIKRGDYNSFKIDHTGKSLSSLDKFADKTLSDKFKYLDDCWYEFEDDALNSDARNAIAHYTAEYNPVSQIITYYPNKEGVKQEQGVEMYFLEFMRMLLKLFRDVHYLHHVIKMMFYHKYLVIDKNNH